MIVVVMGVSGAGKTTIGTALAQALGWPLLDADDYHPPQNVAKMASGVPLEDADRWPWLEKINAELSKLQASGKSAVVSCSALKAVYRTRLTQSLNDVKTVYLHGAFELIRARAASREHRFMPASLLQSQFAALEPPADAIAIDISAPFEACVAKILESLENLADHALAKNLANPPHK